MLDRGSDEIGVEQYSETSFEASHDIRHWPVLADEASFFTDPNGFQRLYKGCSRNIQAQPSLPHFGISSTSEDTGLLSAPVESSTSYIMRSMSHRDDVSERTTATSLHPWDSLDIGADVENGLRSIQREQIQPSTEDTNIPRAVSAYPKTILTDQSKTAVKPPNIWRTLISLVTTEAVFRILLAVVLGGGLLIGMVEPIGDLSYFVAFVAVLLVVFVNLISTTLSKIRELRVL